MIEPLAGTAVAPSQAGGSLLRPGAIEAPAANAAESQAPASRSSFAAALQTATEAGDAPSAASVQPEAMPSAALEPTAIPEPEPVPSAEIEPMPGIEPQASPTPGYEPATLGYAAPASYPTQLAVESQSAAATGSSATPSGPRPYESLIQQAALRNGVEPALLKGLIEQESGFDPNARSSAGALGLTQLMPSTAASLGVRNPLDPTEAVEGGARLLGELLRQFGGNVSDALAAYNAGAGAVQRYGGVPPYPETEAYVSKVLANAQAFRQGA